MSSLLIVSNSTIIQENHACRTRLNVDKKYLLLKFYTKITTTCFLLEIRRWSELVHQFDRQTFKKNLSHAIPYCTTLICVNDYKMCACTVWCNVHKAYVLNSTCTYYQMCVCSIISFELFLSLNITFTANMYVYYRYCIVLCIVCLYVERK